MTTRISGLGSSGLNIDDLVSQMMKAKRVPIDRMKQKVTSLGWQRDAYRDMNTDMSTFQSEAQKLTLQSTFLVKKAAMTVADAEKVKVTPTSSAYNGNFTLDVKQLAKTASITSSGTLGVSSDPTQSLAVADATLYVSGETGARNISITNGDSINQIVSKINAETSNTGVKAVYDQMTDKLTLVSSKTGLAAEVEAIDLSQTGILQNQLKISGATADGTDLHQGQDAMVDFNKSGSWSSIRNNTFTTNGVGFTLVADPGATPYMISASTSVDVDKAVESIKGVFDKYNALIDKANGKLDEAKYRGYDPLTDEQKTSMKDADIKLWEDKAKSGLLRNDSTIASGLQKMRQYLSDKVSGIPSGEYSSLADIGITTAPPGSNKLAYLEQGKIYIDETKLRQALTDNPDQVSNLFTKDGARGTNGKLSVWNDAGIGTRLNEIVKNDLIDGLSQKTQIVPTRSYLNKQIDDYATQITEAESGLTDYEQKLYSQYSQMETALSKINSQSSYISTLFQKA